MYLKKLLYVLLISALILGLCSCGSVETPGQLDGKGDNGDGTGDNLVKGPFPALVSYVGEQQWGYIDESGNFVIKPTFNSAAEFQPNGLAVAGPKGKVGAINRSGSYVIKPKYDSISEFSEGLAIAIGEEGKFYVLDTTGKVIYESNNFISNFKDGMAAIAVTLSDGKQLYGYIDRTGKMVIAPRYQYATDFSDGRAVVKLDTNDFAIIDKDGNVIKSFNYNWMNNLSEGLAAFQPTQENKWGYVDANGKVVIEPKYGEAFAFKDGMAVVNSSVDISFKKFGIIDKKGHYIIKPEYNDTKILGEGMLAAGKAINNEQPFIGSIYALADSNGNLLTTFKFYNVGEFKNGITYADNGKSTFFINNTGKRDTSLPAVEGIGTLKLLNNIISANIDRHLYYIDREGKIIYKPAESVTLKTGVTVSKIKYRPNRNYLVYYPKVSGLSNDTVAASINERLKKMSVTAEVTPEMNLDYSYDGDFDIAFYKKNLQEFELFSYNYPFGAAHGMPTQVFAHVDIKTGAFYELKDLFKKDSDYVKVLSDIVKKQIAEHGDEMGIFPDSYKGIAPDQPFYVNATSLMLYFQPYEIAPYAAGFPTFTIPFKDIKSIIDTNGAFWQSFN